MDCVAPETYLLTSRKYCPLFILNSELYPGVDSPFAQTIAMDRAGIRI